MGNYRLTVEEIKKKLIVGTRLTPLKMCAPKYDKKGKAIAQVECACECGVIKIYRAAQITGKSNTYSCGCMQREKVMLVNQKYPNANKKILSSYYAMLSRCNNKTNCAYHLYGGNGVSVCKEWVDDYFSFEKWSIQNGWEEGLVIDKDILGNGKLYSPATCKWVTQKENSNNKSNNTAFEYNGKILTLSQVSETIGIKRATIDSRLRSGMKFQDAVSLPVQDKLLNLKHKKV